MEWVADETTFTTRIIKQSVTFYFAWWSAGVSPVLLSVHG